MSHSDPPQKDVYAHFGLAYYLSECLHRQLANMYALAPFRSRHDGTRPRVEERLRVAYESPLGALVTEAKTFVPGELHADLDHALRIRNFLAHGFWFDRAGLFFSEEGMTAMIAELEAAQEVFRTISERLQAFWEPRASALGMSREAVEAMMNDVIGVAEPDPLPTTRTPRKRERVVRAWRPERPGPAPLLLEGEDGLFWQLCDAGLGWSYQRPDADWIAAAEIQKHLPAEVVARPDGASPWNYQLHFSTGVLLRITKGEDETFYRTTIKRVEKGPKAAR